MVMLPMLLKYNTIQGKIDAETTDRIATTVPLFFWFLFIINKYLPPRSSLIVNNNRPNLIFKLPG
jgi:hypothetical protein